MVAQPPGFDTILAIIFLSSLVSAVALAAAWASFGRPRHAMSWTLAFAAAAIEAAVTAARVHGVAGVASSLLALCATLVSMVLLLIGALQRARPEKNRLGLTAALIGGPMLLLGAASAIRWTAPASVVALGFYEAAILALTARAIRHRGRSVLPSERPAIVVLVLFAIFEAGLAAAFVGGVVLPDARGALALAITAYLVGYPSLLVATAIAAILVLASDLAERLRALATFDPLTGVTNRRGFEEAALRAIAAARRAGRPLSLALGDIDHFKAINDRQGHAAGDAALRQVAATLGAGLRGADVIGRVGGEEFAVLLVDTPAAHAADVVERLRVRVASLSADRIAGALTMSFGVAALPDADGDGEETLDALVARADRALYAAKAAGRDRVALAD